MTEFVTKRTISFEKSDTGNIKSTSQESHYQFRFTSFSLNIKGGSLSALIAKFVVSQ